MSTKLQDKYKLKPGQFWCRRGRGKFKVFLNNCSTCDERKSCNDYSIAAEAFNKNPVLVDPGPTSCPDEGVMDFVTPEPLPSTTPEKPAVDKVTKPKTDRPAVTPEVEPEPETLPKDLGDGAGDGDIPPLQEWSIAVGKQEMRQAVDIVRGVGEKYAAMPGPKVLQALAFRKESTQLMNEMAKWSGDRGSRFLDGHRRIGRRSNGRKQD